MVSCCIVGCPEHNFKSRTSKRFFPKDPKLKAIWIKNIGREVWMPTANSCICDIHFAPEMWENASVDGKKILKSNAVPTIFPNNESTKDNNSNPSNIPTNEPLTPESEVEIVVEQELETDIIDKSDENIYVDYETLDTSLFENLISEQSACNQIVKSITPLFTDTTSTDNHDCQTQTIVKNLQNQIKLLNKKLKKANRKIQLADKVIMKIDRINRFRFKKLKKLIQENKVLNKNSDLSLFKKVFNDDQIYALTHPVKKHGWSCKTIKNALILKSACGIHGYNELLKQNLPFPSVRTLRRALENNKIK